MLVLNQTIKCTHFFAIKILICRIRALVRIHVQKTEISGYIDLCRSAYFAWKFIGECNYIRYKDSADHQLSGDSRYI